MTLPFPNDTPTNDDGNVYMDGLLPVKYRRFVYRILNPLSVLVLAYGVADQQTVALWAGLIVAVLGDLVAAAHAPVERRG